MTTLALEQETRPGSGRALTLPDFIIAGERRGGTTSLYHWVSAHPDIYLYPVPDMDYFIEEEIRGVRRWRDGEADAERWARTHSVEAYAELFRDGRGFASIGQKDADLLYWKPAHPRLAEYLPECRFIITLRNPVERAWSHYWNEVGKGRETLGFEEALAAEEERSRRSAYARNHLSYLRRGFYEESLDSFFRHISRARVMVVSLEESRRRPKETLAEIYRFIGVDPTKGLDGAGVRHNREVTMVPRGWARSKAVTPLEEAYSRAAEGLIVRLIKDSEGRRKARGYARSIFRKKAVMPEGVRAELSKLYAPHVANLESLLGRSFSEWNLSA